MTLVPYLLKEDAPTPLLKTPYSNARSLSEEEARRFSASDRYEVTFVKLKKGHFTLFVIQGDKWSEPLQQFPTIDHSNGSGYRTLRAVARPPAGRSWMQNFKDANGREWSINSIFQRFEN